MTAHRPGSAIVASMPLKVDRMSANAPESEISSSPVHRTLGRRVSPWQTPACLVDVVPVAEHAHRRRRRARYSSSFRSPHRRAVASYHRGHHRAERYRGAVSPASSSVLKFGAEGDCRPKMLTSSLPKHWPGLRFCGHCRGKSPREITGSATFVIIAWPVGASSKSAKQPCFALVGALKWRSDALKRQRDLSPVW